MRSNKFLIIGGNSFSGSNFITKLLKENNEVISVSRSIEPDMIFLPYKWKNNQRKVNKNYIEKFSFLK